MKEEHLTNSSLLINAVIKILPLIILSYLKSQMFYKLIKKRVAPLSIISPIFSSPEGIDLLCF